MRLEKSFLALMLLATPALADAGHKHGSGKAAGPYDGHAAAMGEPGDAKARGIRTVEIVSDDKDGRMTFRPQTLTIRRGETVRFVVRNVGMLKHELVLGTEAELIEHAKVMERFPDMEHDDPNAVSVEPGKTGSFIWRFTKAGTWDIGFACLLPGHMQSGMKGKLVVM